MQAPSHYVWEVAGKSVSVHLDFNVVDKLAMDVMRGFGAVPKRGAEVGGLLLGSFDQVDGQRVVRIEDFVSVTCDHLKGPSYLLTENDEARFKAAVEAAQNAGPLEPKLVGIYRSHTREALSLSDEDIKLFEQYLGGPDQIIMLVRPFATKTSIGAFFFQESGGFRRESSYLEFPFKRRDLGGGSSLPVRSFTPDLAPINPVADASEGPDLRDWIKHKGADPKSILGIDKVEKPAPAPGTTTAQFRSKWVWIPLSFVFLVVGIVVGFQAALMLNRGDAQTQAANSLSLGLSVKNESGKVVVRWDRTSKGVQNAASGTLRILDGDFSKVVNLDTRQLQNGSVIYMSADNRVGFELEVVTHQKTKVSESADYTPAAQQ